VLDSVVAGAVVGIAALALDAGTVATISFGAVVFVLSMAGFVAYGIKTITTYRRSLAVRFPGPAAGEER
jgi:hypothetical protein